MTDSSLGSRADAQLPGQPLPASVTERFLDAGGVRFRYLQGGATSGFPVLLLHGWPTWAEVWLRVAWVIGARHPWIAPDLPCQGLSSPLPGKDRTLTAYRQAIAAFVDASIFPDLRSWAIQWGERWRSCLRSIDRRAWRKSSSSTPPGSRPNSPDGQPACSCRSSSPASSEHRARRAFGNS